jgi:serine/threonine protein kinase
MTDEKYGPASFAATAFADSIGAVPEQATTDADPAVTPPPPASHESPRSGVGPAADAGPPSSESSLIGLVLNGRYKVKRLLGEGGMGGVYEGEHLEIGKRVAIKIVHELHARDPHIAARIRQEARSTGAVESENIVQVFDAGEDPKLGLFLVMEMLRGEDLASLLARKGRISPMAAATMIMQAAQGLLRAHAAGIVHRDLKPANIFLSTREDGSSLVKLVDFGIAKLVRDANRASEVPGLTRTGMVIGTPQYMSPEQAQGLPTVDHRTDIYSLGAVLFEAIVGTSPYPEMPTYEQTILQIMTRSAPRLTQVMPEVQPELDQLCADMMAHDPNQRPQDMAVVRERLGRVFPEIDGGRLPMRSLTNEVGYDATVPADASGQIRAQMDAALARVSLSGVGLAVTRPPSEPEVKSARQVLEESEAVATALPVPRRGFAIGVGVAVALVAALGIFALFHGQPAPAAAEPYGLVQSNTATPPAAPAPAAVLTTIPAQTPPLPAPVAPAPQTTPAPSPGPASNSGPSKSAHVAATHGHRSGAPAQAAPSAPASGAPTPAAARPVGGTSESTEF